MSPGPRSIGPRGRDAPQRPQGLKEEAKSGSAAPTDAGAPAVQLSGITVRFGDNFANRAVSLSARAGEVHAVVGENGAGKSTLMRALYGLVPLAAGEVQIRGQRISRPSPAQAIRCGVGMVHQHFMLVDTLSVAENVVLGSEPRAARYAWLGAFDARAAEREVGELAARHGLAVDPHRQVGDLSVGEQQRVEILKTLYRGARILILDEPTAVLTPPEVADLFRVLRALSGDGGTVLLVTHKLDEVMTIADRVTVLRRGEVAARFQRGDVTPEAMARAMVGGDPPGGGSDEKNALPALSGIPEPQPQPGFQKPRLVVRNLAVAGRGGRAVAGVSLDVHPGEILGIAGVEGNGQSELVGAIVGMERALRGSVVLDGHDVTTASTHARRHLGLAYVPEDRHRQGLLLTLSVAENLLLGREHLYSRRFLPGIDRRRLDDDARRLVARFDVRPADIRLPVSALSGGNQQKVVVARELAQTPRLLVAAQPTRGVDLFAVDRIHRKLDEARRAGAAVLLVSAELDELLALADRIAVLYRGRLVATLSRAEATRALLSSYMTGAAA